MPLLVSLYDPKTKHLASLPTLLPGDPATSFSNSTIFGRQIYIVTCHLDDTASDITVMREPRTVATRAVRVITPNGPPEAEYHLADGQKWAQLIRTDNMPAARELRLHHVTIDFGVRHCMLCQNDIPAVRYGRHLLDEHEPSETALWKGGTIGFLTEMMAPSTNQF